jgi:hypothetical protein
MEALRTWLLTIDVNHKRRTNHGQAQVKGFCSLFTLFLRFAGDWAAAPPIGSRGQIAIPDKPRRNSSSHTRRAKRGPSGRKQYTLVVSSACLIQLILRQQFAPHRAP